MIKTFTLVLGIILLAVGVWGTVSGGHNHELIIFGINTTHNIVHILSGILAILAALKGIAAAKMYNLAFGAVYGLVTVLGFVNFEPAVTMLNLNMADNFLHLAIASGCLFFGLTTKTAS